VILRAQCGGAFGSALRDAAADQIAKLEDQGHFDGINRTVSILLAGDQVRGEEHGELLGDVGLFHLGAFDKLADARRAFLEYLKDSQPAGFGEDGKEIGDGAELRRLEGPMVIVTGVPAGSLHSHRLTA